MAAVSQFLQLLESVALARLTWSGWRISMAPTAFAVVAEMVDAQR